MWHAASCWLISLKEIIKRTSVFYPKYLKKYKKKLDEHLWLVCFVKVALLHTTAYLKGIRHFARKLKKVLTEVRKDKNAKENINKIKEHEIINTLH